MKPNDHRPPAALLADPPPGPTPPSNDEARGARERVLVLLREALLILDEELDADLVGAKLSECIERLAEPAEVVRGAAEEH